jgi:hypothetical protein
MLFSLVQLQKWWTSPERKNVWLAELRRASLAHFFSYREHEPSPLPPFVAHEGWLNISTLAISHKANSEMFVFLYVNVSYFKQLDTTLPTEQHLVVVWKNPGLQSTWSWATLAVAILLGGESPWPTIRFGRVWHVFCWPMLDFRHMMFELFELS